MFRVRINNLKSGRVGPYVYSAGPMLFMLLWPSYDCCQYVFQRKAFVEPRKIIVIMLIFMIMNQNYICILYVSQQIPTF